MRTLRLPLVMLLGLGVLAHAAAPAAVKIKIIDTFHVLDPKTVRSADIKIKIGSTGDSVRPRALEVTADYANPQNGGWLVKTIPAGLINPKKYSAIRMWVRSETETGFGVGVAGDKPRADGSPMAYGSFVKATPIWTEVVIPFSECVKSGLTVWKDGAQKVYPGGAPIFEEDYPPFTSIGFNFPIEHRGNGTVGKIQIEGVGLVEK